MSRLGNAKPEELAGFGRLLMELAREKGIGAPILLAEALYKNQRELIEPAKRKNKKGKVVKDEAHDLNAITRMVQKHFNEENAYSIQSKYILAYSNLFNVSTDYLFGKTKIRSTDIEVKDICEKTGLSEEAVSRLMKQTKIRLEGYIYSIFDYDYTYRNVDPEAELSISDFWSCLIAKDSFYTIPEQWLKMACSLMLNKILNTEMQRLEKEKIKLPLFNKFFEIVDEYYATSEGDVCPYSVKELTEMYNNDPDDALFLLEDIQRAKWSELAKDEEKSEVAYGGSMSILYKKIEEMLHDMAEEFTIPKLYKE